MGGEEGQVLTSVPGREGACTRLGSLGFYPWALLALGRRAVEAKETLVPTPGLCLPLPRSTRHPGAHVAWPAGRDPGFRPPRQAQLLLCFHLPQGGLGEPLPPRQVTIPVFGTKCRSQSAPERPLLHWPTPPVTSEKPVPGRGTRQLLWS